MIKTYLTLLILAVPLFCNAQENSIDGSTVEIHADKDGRFSNLKTLNADFEGVRVVTLGEQTHSKAAE